MGPRLGFAYSADDRTVVRGGFGRYFGEVTDQLSWSSRINAKSFQVEELNDGRPDFASNPYNGPEPTFDQAVAQWQAGLRPRSLSTLNDPNAQVSYSWQASVGVQRQVADTMSVQADYVFSGTRHERGRRDINLTFNPETGANYPFTDVSKRTFPAWGSIRAATTDEYDNYHALQTGFTKRFSDRWQASGTYTLSRQYQGKPAADSAPLAQAEPEQPAKHPFSAPGVCDVPITLAKDMGGDPYWAGYEHRGTFNGIWDMGYGVQLSGLFFYRNGIQVQSVYGGDLRRMGRSTNRLRPDGSIVPRNNFREKPLSRVDIRLSRRTGLGVGNASFDAMLEVFNLFNHENFGRYITSEVARKLWGATAEHEYRLFAAHRAAGVQTLVLRFWAVVRRASVS